jgi:hypothetical protein
MMHIKFLIFCFSILAFNACKKERHTSSNYYWVIFKGRDYQKTDTLKIDQLEYSTIADTSKVLYVTKFGYTDYRFVNGKDSALIVSNIIDEMLHPNDSIIFSRRFKDTIVRTKSDSFKVSEYILNEDVQDGGVIYYFTPKFGVYAVHSDTWPGIRFLQSNDTALSNEIVDVMNVSIPKFFLRRKFEY